MPGGGERGKGKVRTSRSKGAGVLGARRRMARSKDHFRHRSPPLHVIQNHPLDADRQVPRRGEQVWAGIRVPGATTPARCSGHTAPGPGRPMPPILPMNLRAPPLISNDLQPGGSGAEIAAVGGPLVLSMNREVGRKIGGRKIETEIFLPIIFLPSPFPGSWSQCAACGPWWLPMNLPAPTLISKDLQPEGSGAEIAAFGGPLVLSMNLPQIQGGQLIEHPHLLASLNRRDSADHGSNARLAGRGGSP